MSVDKDIRVKLGMPPTYNDKDQMVCPVCGAVQELDEFQPGYGFAYGGGLGTYWYCTASGCDWFYKIIDPAES